MFYHGIHWHMKLFWAILTHISVCPAHTGGVGDSYVASIMPLWLRCQNMNFLWPCKETKKIFSDTSKSQNSCYFWTNLKCHLNVFQDTCSLYLPFHKILLWSQWLWFRTQQPEEIFQTSYEMLEALSFFKIKVPIWKRLVAETGLRSPANLCTYSLFQSEIFYTISYIFTRFVYKDKLVLCALPFV